MHVRYARWYPIFFFALALANLVMGLLLLSMSGQPSVGLFLGIFFVGVAFVIWRAQILVLHPERLGVQNPVGMELRSFTLEELTLDGAPGERILYGQKPNKRKRRIAADKTVIFEKSGLTALLDEVSRRLGG